jgi:hypothetical protein
MLLAELKVEHDEWSARGFGGNSPFRPPTLEIRAFEANEYVCVHCGIPFLDHYLPGNMIRLCSNRCERERRATQQRQWA